MCVTAAAAAAANVTCFECIEFVYRILIIDSGGFYNKDFADTSKNKNWIPGSSFAIVYVIRNLAVLKQSEYDRQTGRQTHTGPYK